MPRENREISFPPLPVKNTVWEQKQARNRLMFFASCFKELMIAFYVGSLPIGKYIFLSNNKTVSLENFQCF